MKIKHSKYKNTGILFELLVRQITADTLKNQESPAVDLLKKYFIQSPLGREYKLYESLSKSKILTEDKANIVLNTLLESSNRLDRDYLNSLKYELISEIKEHYNLDIFFSAKLKNYKEYAALYTLIESQNTKKNIDLNQIIENKITILEHLTNKDLTEKKDMLFEDMKSLDKEVRILTYNVLLEKFNSKYKDFSSEQKEVLREYVESVNSTKGLRNFYNNRVEIIKETIENSLKLISSQPLKIKLKEVKSLLKTKPNTQNIQNEDLENLLQYYELLNEMKKII